MNLVLVFCSTVLAMEFTQSLSIPFIERKSWIRSKRESSSRRHYCPDCLAEDEGSDCLTEQEDRRRLAMLTRSNEYVPACRKDGTYAPVQCHPGTKSCWCVTHTGRPIVGSTVLDKKPSCTKYNRGAKSATRRRSSQARKNRQMCNHADRATFNTALIRTFRSEFNRIRSLSSAFADLDPNRDDVVLAWKFDHLDQNRDNNLHRNETNNLKRLVKQQIKPRQCARNFVSFCAKGDPKISKSEWLDCLRVDAVENLPFDTFNSLVDSGSSRGMQPFQLLRPVPGGTGLAPPLNARGSDPVIEISNCWTDRQSALTSQQLDSNKSIIIPECAANGQYQKTQCARGKAYCWCVNETTGLEIPETVAVNSMPNCDKQMKGCMGKKKEKFLVDLMDSLTKMMSLGDQRRLHGDFRNISIEERAGRWHFERLDADQNRVLDRREWKVFRNETSADKKLKKCGKKFPRHCDVNKDKRITLQEWLDCLEVKNEPNASKRTSQRSSGGPRSGKNPFTTILQR